VKWKRPKNKKGEDEPYIASQGYTVAKFSIGKPDGYWCYGAYKGKECLGFFKTEDLAKARCRDESKLLQYSE
jgi:hypothetical protein